MSNEPPPSYCQSLLADGKIDTPRPSAPPDDPERIEMAADELTKFLNSKQGQDARVVVYPNPAQMPPTFNGTPLNLAILKDSCQTPDGGRYIVQENGVIKHVSGEVYAAENKKQKKRQRCVAIGFLSVIGGICLVIVICYIVFIWSI